MLRVLGSQPLVQVKVAPAIVLRAWSFQGSAQARLSQMGRHHILIFGLVAGLHGRLPAGSLSGNLGFLIFLHFYFTFQIIRM